MNAASLVWIGAAALGLGALAPAFPDLFRAIAIAGALYVAWLGANALWAAWRDRAAPLEAGRTATAATAFRDGFAVQFANPKAVVFFTAVLPPFVDPARPAAPQLILLAATVLAADLLAMSGYGLAGGMLASVLRQARVRRLFSALAGALLVIAALMIGLRGRSQYSRPTLTPARSQVCVAQQNFTAAAPARGSRSARVLAEA
jgi:threonine/homoserine/homoserine lactone efflux protein